MMGRPHGKKADIAAERRQRTKRSPRTEMQKNWAGRGFKQDGDVEEKPTRHRKSEIERSTDKQARALEARTEAREAGELAQKPGTVVATVNRGGYNHLYVVQTGGSLAVKRRQRSGG